MEGSITYDNYLEHYGVKGMKWGVRKSDKSKARKAKKDALDEPNENYTSGQRDYDAMRLGKNAPKRINRHMNSGSTRPQAIRKEERRIATQAAAVVASHFAIPVAMTAVSYGYGKTVDKAQAVNADRRKAEAKRRAGERFSNKRGIADHRVIDLEYLAGEWR